MQLSSLLQGYLIGFLLKLMLLLQCILFSFFHSNPLHLLFLSSQLLYMFFLSAPLLNLEASLVSFNYALFAQGLLRYSIVLSERIIAIRAEK